MPTFSIMVKSLLTRQFAHFLVAGGIAAAVNFLVGWSLSGTLPWHGDIAVGYTAGMMTAFVLFEQRVFGEHGQSRQKSILVFVLVNFLGLLQTWVVYALLKDHLFPALAWNLYPAEVARAVAIAIPMLSSFVGHKFFTFRQ